MNRISMMLFAPVLALAACTGGNPGEQSAGLIDAALDEARQEIAKELANEAMSLGKGPNGEPLAEITPEGELLIGGKPVAMDAAQREKALAYRNQLVAVAESGATIGLEGASLAKEAVGAALKAAASGEDPATIEADIQAKAAGMKASAKALCDSLPALYAAQQALRQAVPEFEPYAQMDEGDIKDCRVNP